LIQKIELNLLLDSDVQAETTLLMRIPMEEDAAHQKILVTKVKNEKI